MRIPIQRALVSVSDKQGLAEFARGLLAAGVEIVSTGGTRRHLEREGCAASELAAYTGFPEMMGGRLKTLHPLVFGGILCRRDDAADRAAAEAHQMRLFDLVVVNLYPFSAAVARAETTFPEAIEQIDIGGPSLIRAAAKNHAHVAVAVRPDQYAELLAEIRAHGGLTAEQRRRLAGEAFVHTADYDRAIARYFASQLASRRNGAEPPLADAFPERIDLDLRRQAILRHGENPHQSAALYRLADEPQGALVDARQLNGKELSYNNYLDLDSAWAVARPFERPAAAVIKHNNPCGAAVADTLADAAEKALAGDPVSAFGSVLGFNRTVDVDTAELLSRPGLFVEAIVAPDFAAAAVGVLTTRPKWRDNVRLLQLGWREDLWTARNHRQIEGGLLVQTPDTEFDAETEWRVVSQAVPTPEQWRDLRFAWALARHVKSNAIVLAKNEALCGVGAGQMSRVDSVDIAIRKAGDRAAGSALGSDAFFPFADSIHAAAAAGVAAIIQPGGSKRDAEVIAACDQHKLAMVFTGRRHFRH